MLATYYVFNNIYQKVFLNLQDGAKKSVKVINLMSNNVTVSSEDVTKCQFCN